MRNLTIALTVLAVVGAVWLRLRRERFPHERLEELCGHPAIMLDDDPDDAAAAELDDIGDNA